MKRISKGQALALAFVCYLGFTVSTFGLPSADVQARVMAAWNEIVKAIDPTKKQTDTLEDFAKF
ncbi:hypothetical protein AB832_07025 [Flavobacteriaceae bacterium (ex Bugula neritina AB1)]|nr:hypothetical protein AB832_07025 [Flavobacteriaceae bacterium (ex Bugula neritina AB1)]